MEVKLRISTRLNSPFNRGPTRFFATSRQKTAAKTVE